MGHLSTRKRITSRENWASTRTRAASLEKIEQTGSIKINKSIVDNKSGYKVERRSVSRPGSMTVTYWDKREGSWTEKGRHQWKGEGRGDSCLWGKVLIVKVKYSMILPARQGNWISISVCNLNKKSNIDICFQYY